MRLFGAGGGGAVASGSYQFVSTTAITAVANIDFTGLAAGFDYIFSMRAVFPNVADVLACRLSQAGTFNTGSSYYRVGSAALQTSLFVTGSTLSTTGIGLSGEVLLEEPGNTAHLKGVISISSYLVNGAAFSALTGGGGLSPGNNNAVDGIRFFWSGGNNFIASGEISVFKRQLS